MDRAAPALDIGIDVGKNVLNIAYFGNAHPQEQMDNSGAAIGRWLKRLPAHCRIGIEATGTYHERLADLAVAAGHTVFVLNPRELAHYLRALRTRAKTDGVDARGIARYVHNETDQCHPYHPPTPTQRAVARLIGRRALLVKQRAALRMGLRDMARWTISVAGLFDAFDTLIALIDQRIHALIERDAALAQQRRRLATICGFGPLVSAAMCVRLSRHPYPNSDALVAAVGIDPRARDSGTQVGRRKLSKHGNPEERRLLYMAAKSACRNAHWKARKKQLLQRGLPVTAAYCIIARQLLRIAFAIWKDRSAYDPNRTKIACAET